MSSAELVTAWLGPAVFLAWWTSWTLLWCRWVRHGRGGLPALLGYELALVPLVLAAAAITACGNAAFPQAATTWPFWCVPLVAVPVGIAAWSCFTGLSGPKRLQLRWRSRRLLVGTGLNTWSAAGEEVAFRLLLLSGLAAWSQNTLLAWLIVSVLFGLHHFPVSGGRVALLHIGSGAIFGALMVSGGGLAAAVLAHVTYNVLAGIAREAGMQRIPRVSPHFGLRH